MQTIIINIPTKSNQFELPIKLPLTFDLISQTKCIENWTVQTVKSFSKNVKLTDYAEQ